MGVNELHELKLDDYLCNSHKFVFY